MSSGSVLSAFLPGLAAIETALRRGKCRVQRGEGGDGRIDAKVTTGWDAYAPLAGELQINTSQIFWLELFTPDLVRPQGKLEGNITLAGCWCNST